MKNCSQCRQHSNRQCGEVEKGFILDPELRFRGQRACKQGPPLTFGGVPSSWDHTPCCTDFSSRSCGVCFACDIFPPAAALVTGVCQIQSFFVSAPRSVNRLTKELNPGGCSCVHHPKFTPALQILTSNLHHRCHHGPRPRRRGRRCRDEVDFDPGGLAESLHSAIVSSETKVR